MSNAGDVQLLQSHFFPIYSKGSDLTALLESGSRSTQLVFSSDDEPVARLREPRELYCDHRPVHLLAHQSIVRWPIECEVLEQGIQHNQPCCESREPLYRITGKEPRPEPVGDECGRLVFAYNPTTHVSYFTRSCTGGIPCVDREYKDIIDTTIPLLEFESRFESGNLSRAVSLSPTFYQLYLRPDLYTNRYTQWFYFQVTNMKRDVMYRFSIVNLLKGDSLYRFGMKPVLYSQMAAQDEGVGWRRWGENIAYYRNNGKTTEDGNLLYTLTFTVHFPHDDDVAYLAHSYPYTYSDLQTHLLSLQNDPQRSLVCKQRLLCKSIAGNNVYVLTVTSPNDTSNPSPKQVVVMTARVHPGESPSSYVMKGIIDHLTGPSASAIELRNRFVFKLVPMLNPDGVVVGNHRCSLAARDLNRQYRSVLREAFPSVWSTREMIRRLMEENPVVLLCDLHAHSRKSNVFMYGCENSQRLSEQVLPLILAKRASDKFSFESCKFCVQRCKEGTGRVSIWAMGVNNSFTMEVTFAGSTRTRCHFNINDYEEVGRNLCEALLDYSDPRKDRLRAKILFRLIRRGSSAEEPTNIRLSDYSSSDSATEELPCPSSPPLRPPLSPYSRKKHTEPPVRKKKKHKKKVPVVVNIPSPAETRYTNDTSWRQPFPLPCVTLSLSDTTGPTIPPLETTGVQNYNQRNELGLLHKGRLTMRTELSTSSTDESPSSSPERSRWKEEFWSPLKAQCSTGIKVTCDRKAEFLYWKRHATYHESTVKNSKPYAQQDMDIQLLQNQFNKSTLVDGRGTNSSHKDRVAPKKLCQFPTSYRENVDNLRPTVLSCAAGSSSRDVVKEMPTKEPSNGNNKGNKKKKGKSKNGKHRKK